MSTASEFRTKIFAKIEQRRKKLAAFSYRQMWCLISNSKHLFLSPESKEAQEGLDTIIDEGTFVLVADSLSAFLELFPAADCLYRNKLPVRRGCDAHVALNREVQCQVRAGAHSSKGEHTSDSHGPQGLKPKLKTCLESGSAVDPDKFKKLMGETASVRSLLAARNPEHALPETTLTAHSRPGRPSDRAQAQVSDLDDRHKRVLQNLLQRTIWTWSELRAVTSRYGLMPAACVDQINKWSQQNFDDLLLEGDQTININPDLKGRIEK